MRLLLLNLASILAACNASASTSRPLQQSLLNPIVIGFRRAAINLQPTRPASRASSTAAAISAPPQEVVSRGGAAVADGAKPPPARLLRWAYAAAGAATTGAWATMTYTTIRSNQPPGAMMPCWQHPFFARIGAMAVAPLIVGSMASLAGACNGEARSWEELGDGSPSFRRHNLALATTGVASSLWVKFADVVTRIPGTDPVACHQKYSAAMQGKLIGCYGGAAALGALVWARSLPEDCRNPLKRVVDGVSKGLVSIAPKDVGDPVQVKYSLLTTSFLVFTGMQTVCNMPISVIPSWTSRRLSRAFPIWTLLGAVTSFDLKEAAENGKLLVDTNYRYLSNGVRTFGGLYLGARAGAICFDPSFPSAFHAVNQVPGLAVAAMLMVGLTLRSDEK
ncbi:hypothetical protein ACHAXT_008453 [Thalassiosira profunda]